MIGAASKALASAVQASELESGLLFPAIGRLREVTRQVTRAVIERAAEDGVSTISDNEDLDEKIGNAMWEPCYPRYVPA